MRVIDRAQLTLMPDAFVFTSSEKWQVGMVVASGWVKEFVEKPFAGFAIIVSSFCLNFAHLGLHFVLRFGD